MTIPTTTRLAAEGSETSGPAAHGFDDVAALFRPIFADIAETAVRRETDRDLPFDAVHALKAAGFGALRIPTEFGGFGLSLEELFVLLIELGAADSNLPQLLRGHVAFVETQLALPKTERRDRWFRRIADRDILFGNAQAELGEATNPSTAITERDGRLLLNGRKFYSTGTLYADWIWSMAHHEGELVALAVSATAAGVSRIDDWDGFGQRLTGSGTTVFEDVEIDPAEILPSSVNDAVRPHAYIAGLYQLILLAALAGIGRAAEREAIDFVRPRTRTFGVPGLSSPREDPLVQRVVGKVSSLRFAVDATVLAAVRGLERTDTHRRRDETDEAAYQASLIGVYEAQQVVIDLVLSATSDLFEVGGASAVTTGRQLDRLWRNARTISSHNPAILRERAIGDYHLNGTPPITRLHAPAQAQSVEETAQPTEETARPTDESAQPAD
ncbi:acyl-CoA dehydrogenase family protein [Plantibacter sp. YIM 135249]|uniref:acyl-CoA dehydrogenase family protein n=1 Tax=Plantibacter sp. YIM 135249 TaxID=3423918 RepID=UPI003D3442C3